MPKKSARMKRVAKRVGISSWVSASCVESARSLLVVEIKRKRVSIMDRLMWRSPTEAPKRLR